MRGEFIGVWPELWLEIWNPLLDEHEVESDIFCELYRELDSALKTTFTAEQLADIIDNPAEAEDAFRNATASELRGERATVAFLEAAFDSLEEFGGDELSNAYFGLLESVIEKYSLRYDLRRPCLLCPTVPGVFANLMRDLRDATSQNPHLDGLMKDFEEAVRDLRQDASDSRIRTVMVKQVNLLEAMGSMAPGVTENTVGKICGQVNTWPHKKVKEAMQCLYSFTCNYPGIRHGGDPNSALRTIEMRDMVSMSILLAGFMPYLTDQVDAEVIYRGA